MRNRIKEGQKRKAIDLLRTTRKPYAEIAKDTGISLSRVASWGTLYRPEEVREEIRLENLRNARQILAEQKKHGMHKKEEEPELDVTTYVNEVKPTPSLIKELHIELDGTDVSIDHLMHSLEHVISLVKKDNYKEASFTIGIALRE